MPRRRRYNTFSKREIRSLGILILATPVIIGGCVLIYFMNSVAKWLNNTLGIPSEYTFSFSIIASVALFIGISIALIFAYEKNKERKYRGINIANIDTMDGIEFERYLQKLLIDKGYIVSMTSASGDLGVDLIAVKNDRRVAIQAKRYNSNVSRRAISDAVAGMHHYGCNQAMVITNSYFSPGAITLAQSTNCILVDRHTLAEWINEFQSINSEKFDSEKNEENSQDNVLGKILD